jgi:flagellar hook-basal body complex protein FliE
MDIRATLAAQSYGQARQATQIAAPRAERDAANAFSEAIRNFTDTVQRGESLATAAMTTGADPYALVTALAQTELAVETAVTVRDKVVEAYQEILRMPV